MKNLPKTVWIVRENEGTDDEFMVPYNDIESIDDGSVVGEYTLTTLNIKRSVHSLDRYPIKQKR